MNCKEGYGGFEFAFEIESEKSLVGHEEWDLLQQRIDSLHSKVFAEEPKVKSRPSSRNKLCKQTQPKRKGSKHNLEFSRLKTFSASEDYVNQLVGVVKRHSRKCPQLKHSISKLNKRFICQNSNP